MSGWTPAVRRGRHGGERRRPALPAPIEALEPLLPTTYGIDEQVDWAVAEARWGARFPADYKAFMRAYGEGSVDGAIVVHRPLPMDAPEGERTPDAMAEGTGTVREVWKAEADEVWADPAGPDLVLDPGALLAWGATAEAAILCWLTMDEDPDRWPVVVCGRHTVPTFALYRFGMAEFLRRLLTGGFDMPPVTVDGVPWPRPHAFVSRAVQRARRRAGLDPWTGEPVAR
ncbi:SMI1/KNR4 family protein [Streptomyces sp. B1I3]|uniref:SMI1/KNR4 family protein n=1 Tax=Streptomyces sp. B1I3 TaxID=3042264 RepID=UPI0027D864F1|nr:SMI1/KNR4 family protein [Streptomyces sp. B1I3]